MASALVVLAGAGVYSLLQRSNVVGFAATPLTLGVIAVLAGLAGTRRRVVATGLALCGWGGAVLLVDHGVVPADRTTPAYMLGMGIGLAVVAIIAPKAARGDWLASAAVVTVTGPLSLYVAYDVSTLGRWPVWAVFLLAWAAWEGFWAWRGSRASGPSPALTG